MGLPQGSVLSPVLFNVYLEEAIRSSKKLEEVRSRGDLLAFADDMLVMSNQEAEVGMIIEELAKVQQEWNLRLNKKEVRDTHRSGEGGDQWDQMHNCSEIFRREGDNG